MDRENRGSRRRGRRLGTLLVRSAVLAVSSWSLPSMVSVTLAGEASVAVEGCVAGTDGARRAHAVTPAGHSWRGAAHAIWLGELPAEVQRASAEVSDATAPTSSAPAKADICASARPLVIDLNIPWSLVATLQKASASEVGEQLPAEVVASAAPALATRTTTATAPSTSTAADKDATAVQEAPTATEAQAATAPEVAAPERAAENGAGEQVGEEEFLALRGTSQSTVQEAANERELEAANDVSVSTTVEEAGELPLSMPEVAPPAKESELAKTHVRRFPAVDREVAGQDTGDPDTGDREAASKETLAAPEPGPESDLEPVAEHEVRWSPLPESVVERVRKHNRRAIEMAGHGAVYSSRAEFVKALRLVSHSLDSQGNTYRHTVALKNAMVALDESADFEPSGSQRPSDLDLSRIVMNHQTTLLRDRVLDDMAPAAAARAYHRYAEGQFAIACGQELVAADAMYGMARLQPLINAHDPNWANRQAHVAMAYYQAALQVYPKHYLAGQELGLLLARDGQFQEARDVLEQAVSAQPKLPQAWQYLAEVHRQLGDDQSAATAEREYVALAKGRGTQGDADTVVVADASPNRPTKKQFAKETVEAEGAEPESQLAEAPLPSTDSPLAWDDPKSSRVPSEDSEPKVAWRRATESDNLSEPPASASKDAELESKEAAPEAEVADQRSAEPTEKKSFWSRWSFGKKK